VIKAPADIADFPLLHLTSTPNRWSGWMAEAGVALDGSLRGQTYQNFAMLAQAAVAGLGIALLPCYLVEEEIKDGRLEIVGTQFFDIKTSYYILLPETRASSAAVQTFANWLIAEARSWRSDIGRRANRKPARR
jgi:LysR family glycine cleavage system transcriptional activator